MLPSGRSSGKDKNARADNGADAERRERPGAKRFFEPVLGFIRLGDEPVNGFAGQQLASGPVLRAGRVLRRLRQWLLALHIGAPRLAPALQCDYRFAVPRASFFTLRFADPRAYSRGLSGVSVAFFLREARFDFLRSALLSFLVFAMKPFR